MAKIEVTIGCFKGSGATLKAAREDAQSQAQAALRGSYRPIAQRFGTMIYLAWREPETGWRGTWLVGYDGKEASGALWGSSMADDPAALIESARFHAAQLQWTRQGSDDAPDWLTPKQAEEFASWVRFQRRYEEAELAGLSDDKCHKYGGGWFATIEAARAA